VWGVDLVYEKCQLPTNFLKRKIEMKLAFIKNVLFGISLIILSAVVHSIATMVETMN